MKNLFFCLTAFMLLFSTSCSDDDNGVTVSAPVLGITSPNVDVAFFTEGTLPAPSVTWGSEVGSFELAAPIVGVNVNAVTGVISYDKSLPAGESSIGLIARNSGGQASQTVTINNKFSGSFSGVYTNGDNDNFGRTHKSVFNEDGSYSGEDNGSSSSTTEGTWTRTGNVITAKYGYGTTSGYFLTVEILNTRSEAKLDGNWANGNDAPGTFGGYMKMEID